MEEEREKGMGQQLDSVPSAWRTPAKCGRAPVRVEDLERCRIVAAALDRLRKRRVTEQAVVEDGPVAVRLGRNARAACGRWRRRERCQERQVEARGLRKRLGALPQHVGAADDVVKRRMAEARKFGADLRGAWGTVRLRRGDGDVRPRRATSTPACAARGRQQGSAVIDTDSGTASNLRDCEIARRPRSGHPSCVAHSRPSRSSPPPRRGDTGIRAVVTVATVASGVEPRTLVPSPSLLPFPTRGPPRRTMALRRTTLIAQCKGSPRRATTLRGTIEPTARSAR